MCSVPWLVLLRRKRLCSVAPCESQRFSVLLHKHWQWFCISAACCDSSSSSSSTHGLPDTNSSLPCHTGQQMPAPLQVPMQACASTQTAAASDICGMTLSAMCHVHADHKIGHGRSPCYILTPQPNHAGLSRLRLSVCTCRSASAGPSASAEQAPGAFDQPPSKAADRVAPVEEFAQNPTTSERVLPPQPEASNGQEQSEPW